MAETMQQCYVPLEEGATLLPEHHAAEPTGMMTQRMICMDPEDAVEELCEAEVLELGYEDSPDDWRTRAGIIW